MKLYVGQKVRISNEPKYSQMVSKHMCLAAGEIMTIRSLHNDPVTHVTFDECHSEWGRYYCFNVKDITPIPFPWKCIFSNDD